jgi:sigma-B regulation protein RsbU (phosphoserine phosphatase)
MDTRRLAAVVETGLLDTPAEEPFDRLARLASTVLGTPYAFVTIVDDKRSFWKSCIGVDDTDPADRQNAVEESFCQYVVGSGKPLIVGNTLDDPVTRDNPSNVSMGVRAWAGFPLRNPKGDVLGTFCVVDTHVRTWTERDEDVLRTLADAASGEIALREAAQRSAAFARTLQESLLPPILPQVEGIVLTATYHSANDGGGVLGDFFDVFEAGGRWLALIGDVCGHGVEAAKVAALARWTVRATSAGKRPAEILENLHELLLQHVGSEETFLTAQLAMLDVLPDGRVDVALAGAGHPPALVRRSDGTVEEHGLGGSPLGLLGDTRVAEERFTLDHRDILVHYTDGLTEARTGSELLGGDSVSRLLAEYGGDEVAAALEVAALDAAGGTLRDDLAIVVIRPSP